ncbi:MAG: hypothetical protein ABSF98_29765 [Bryobacteraceae bacterium]|jgi:hypothetical protein
MRLALFTLSILALALVAAPSVFAQGAIASISSFTDPAQFTDVSCIGNADSKPVRGLLSFDPLTRVQCEAADGAGFAIPYAAVTRLVLHEGDKTDTSSRFSFHELLPHREMLKSPFGTDRFLTIYFNDAQGHVRSSAVRLDNKNWKILLAVAENKTGRKVERHSKGDNWNWSGAW